MRFAFQIQDGKLELLYRGESLLGEMYLTVATQRDGTCELYGQELEIQENSTVVRFGGSDRVTKAELRFTECGASLQCRAAISTAREQTRVNYYFAANDSIRLHFRVVPKVSDNFITDASTKLWFQTPSFSRDLTRLPPQTQDIHIRLNTVHVHLFPLVSDDLRTEFKGDALVASVGCGGVSEAEGYILTLAVGGDPYQPIRDNFTAGRKTGAIAVPLRYEREKPVIFSGLGWCTWDAFYQEPSSDKIFRKLEELKRLGIHLNYVLIDDGWSQVRDMRLWSFREDLQKFPDGLSACIARIKQEYGIPYVGVWQAFNGYWKGIHPDGPVAKEMGSALLQCPNGLLIPAPEQARNYAFWNHWHRYLQAQGVDFVKVDNQTTYSYYIDDICRNVAGVWQAHEGLERSVFEHFGGKMINCMGMGVADQLTRPRSALNRNSNDFLPKLQDGFVRHIQANIYNAPVHSQLMYCDYDMWWSRHESAKPSSVLRAISGGPVYISDPIGETDRTYLTPLCEPDGSVPQLDSQAMPTYDCFYRDCPRDCYPLKVFNRCGENFAVAAFGLSDETVQGSLRLADIPGASGEYLICEYFSGIKQRMGRETEIRFQLDKYEVLLWNLYPIRDGIALVGDPSLYMGCASQKQESYTMSETTLEVLKIPRDSLEPSLTKSM